MAFAQQSMDFSRIVTPLEQAPRGFDAYLVQLAWYNSPGNLVYKRNIDIAAAKEKLTYWEWLKDAQVSFNLNEGNLVSNESTENIFFPRYNLGLSLNLGSIASRPTQTRIAKEEKKIAELEEQQQMLKVRREVLSRYEDYELAVEILKSKTNAAQEAEDAYNFISEKFKNGKVEFQDYNTASVSYHNANEALAEAKAQVKKSTLALEELIGIPWEKAMLRNKKKKDKDK
jgi:outer membrane protein TolC